MGDIVCLAVAEVPVLLVIFFAGLAADATFLVVAGFFLGCLSSGVLPGMLRS